MTEKEETYSYKGWLNSDSFIKRAFGVLGYVIVAELFIAIIITGLAIIGAGFSS